MSRSVHFAYYAVSVAAIGLASSVGLADLTQWNTNVNGFFHQAINWSNGVPGADDLAYFGRGSGVTYSVTFASLPGQPQGTTNYTSGTPVWPLPHLRLRPDRQRQRYVPGMRDEGGSAGEHNLLMV